MPLEVVNEDWGEHIEREKEKIIEEIALQLSRDNPSLFSGSMTQISYEEIEGIVRAAVLSRKDLMPNEIEGAVAVIMGQISGWGPLIKFFIGEGSEDITEVLVNSSANGPLVFYGKDGRHWPAKGVYFKDNEEVTRYCQKICEEVGKSFTQDKPYVDAWLRDGSRIAIVGFNAMALGPSFTIRKSPLIRPPLPLTALLVNGTLPELAAEILIELVKGHANMGFLGPTDSGKTSFMRALGQYIDPIERVIIGETSYELAFPHLQNCINMLEVKDGDKVIMSMTQICDAINRSNPDRAIGGEMRGGEIVAMSEIAESTSGGFWTTAHAGGVNEFRSRIPKMFAKGGMPLAREYVDDQIRAMFHFLIFLDKDSTNKRVLISIIEVTEDGYRTIIQLDEKEYGNTGKRRWIYDNAITEERLGRLAFRGADIGPNLKAVTEKYLYPVGGDET